MDAPATPPLFVGIDVSKDCLDVATSAGQAWHTSNEVTAIEVLIAGSRGAACAPSP